MLAPEEAEQVLIAWATGGGLSDVKRIGEPDAHAWWRAQKVSAAVEGRVAVGEYDFILRVGVRSNFPLSLPEVAVASCTPSLTLPHVSADGKLCFTPDDSFVLDRRNPTGILADSLERALCTLRLATGPCRGHEFLVELSDYWRERATLKAVRCNVGAGDSARGIYAFFEKQRLVAFADSQGALAQSYSSRSASQFTAVRALYLPLDCPHEESFDPGQLLQPEVLRTASSAVDGAQKLFDRSHNVNEYLVLGVRTPNGQRVLLGIHAKGDGSQHPLAGGTAMFEAVSCQRVDKAILAPRGGADTGLSAARVAVIGCGAVGGHVATALARTGVGELCLVDPDTFRIENSFRHVCGMARCDENKATGLMADLLRAVPHLRVTAEPKSIEEVLRRKPDFLEHFDLVVCATGSPTLELHLNELQWKARGGPMIFAWLEPLGLGQHLVLTNPRSQAGRGCLDCLWEHDASGVLANRAAFAGHADYTRNLQGCGARHLPFANLDAEELSMTAARVALEVLAGRVQGPELHSKKGNATIFGAAGFATRRRFELSQPQLHDGRGAFGRADCPVCLRDQ